MFQNAFPFCTSDSFTVSISTGMAKFSPSGHCCRCGMVSWLRLYFAFSWRLMKLKGTPWFAFPGCREPEAGMPTSRFTGKHITLLGSLYQNTTHSVAERRDACYLTVLEATRNPRSRYSQSSFLTRPLCPSCAVFSHGLFPGHEWKEISGVSPLSYKDTNSITLGPHP